jgi:hypothetical protein
LQGVADREGFGVQLIQQFPERDRTL